MGIMGKSRGGEGDDGGGRRGWWRSGKRMERRRKGEGKWKWIIKKWKGETKGVGMMVGGKRKGEREGNDGERERRRRR